MEEISTIVPNEDMNSEGSDGEPSEDELPIEELQEFLPPSALSKKYKQLLQNQEEKRKESEKCAKTAKPKVVTPSLVR